MKNVILVLMCLGLFGCATCANRINALSIGMSKQEVLRIMGTPVSTSAKSGTEYLNYQFPETQDDFMRGITAPYAVCLENGKVTSFGRHGDFGTTESAAQVIKIVGDQRGDVDGIENKIKTLNKLLSDGLITKDEFATQKAKLLDQYSIK